MYDFRHNTTLIIMGNMCKIRIKQVQISIRS